MQSQKKLQRLALFATMLVSTTGAPMLQGLTPAVHAAPEAAKRSDAFVDSIGVNVHLGYTDTAYGNYSGIIKPKLKELGIRHIRDTASLDTEYANKLKDLSSSGIRPTLISHATPPLQVVAIASSLKNIIVAIEGPNESDLEQYGFSYNGQGFPEGTRAYQRDLYQAMNNDPVTASIPVLLPSVGWGGSSPELGYIPDGDFGTMHPYPYQGGLFIDALDPYFLPNVRIIAGNDKPLQTTETGYFTLPGVEAGGLHGISEKAAGKYLPRLLLESFNRDIKRTFLYELINLSDGSDNIEHNFGLLKANGSPKPSYTAIKNLIYLLKDPGAANLPLGSLDYTLSGDMTKVSHTLVQKGSGSGLPPRFFLVLWQENKSWDNTNKRDIAVPNRKLTLTLNTRISRATAYLPINSINPISDSTAPTGGRINNMPIEVPDHPLVIRLIP